MDNEFMIKLGSGIALFGGITLALGIWTFRHYSNLKNQANNSDLKNRVDKIDSAILGGDTELETEVALAGNNVVVAMYRAIGENSLDDCKITITHYGGGKAKFVKDEMETILTTGEITTSAVYVENLRAEEFQVNYRVISKKHRWDNSYKFKPTSEGWSVLVSKKKNGDTIANYPGNISLEGHPDRIK